MGRHGRQGTEMEAAPLPQVEEERGLVEADGETREGLGVDALAGRHPAGYLLAPGLEERRPAVGADEEGEEDAADLLAVVDGFERLYHLVEGGRVRRPDGGPLPRRQGDRGHTRRRSGARLWSQGNERRGRRRFHGGNRAGGCRWR